MDETREGRAAQQAADWLARLNARSVTSAELDAFYAWRSAPGHAEAFERVERIWRDARALGGDSEIAQAVRDALGRPRGLATRGRSIGRRGLVAACVALPVLLGAGWWWRRRAEEFTTGIGEQRSIALADGSRVHLNTASRVRVDLEDSVRRVSLLEGQALFDVRPDTRRPFTVHAGNVAVRVLGTRFDVHKTDAQIMVVLSEGRVALQSDTGRRAQLDRPGAAAHISDAGDITLSRADLEASSAWTLGKLIFHRTPLGQAIAEANRYAPRQIELSDPSLARLEVDGVFEIGDLDSFVAAITTLFRLRAQPRGEDRLVLTRA